MTWFIAIDSMAAIEESEAATEEEAKEVATLKFKEWLDRGEVAWLIERE